MKSTTFFVVVLLQCSLTPAIQSVLVFVIRFLIGAVRMKQPIRHGNANVICSFLMLCTERITSKSPLIPALMQTILMWN